LSLPRAIFSQTTPSNNISFRRTLILFSQPCPGLQRTVGNATTKDATTKEYYNERIQQRTIFINKIRMLQRTNTTTNEYYNEQFLSIKSGCYNERCYNEQILQRTIFINKIRMLQRKMLQRTNTTTNEYYNEQILSIKSGCYNERCYNERILQRTIFINKIRMLQRTQKLQRTRRNTIGRRSTRVCMTCSIIVSTKERLFMLFMSVRLFMLYIRERMFIVYIKERLFMLYKFTCTV